MTVTVTGHAIVPVMSTQCELVDRKGSQREPRMRRKTLVTLRMRRWITGDIPAWFSDRLALLVISVCVFYLAPGVY